MGRAGGEALAVSNVDAGDDVDAPLGVPQDLADDRGGLRRGADDQRVLEVPDPALAESAHRRAKDHQQDHRQRPDERDSGHRNLVGPEHGERDQEGPAPERGHLQDWSDFVRRPIVGPVAVQVVQAMGVGEQDPPGDAEQKQNVDRAKRVEGDLRGEERQAQGRDVGAEQQTPEQAAPLIAGPGDRILEATGEHGLEYGRRGSIRLRSQRRARRRLNPRSGCHRLSAMNARRGPRLPNGPGGNTAESAFSASCVLARARERAQSVGQSAGEVGRVLRWLRE